MPADLSNAQTDLRSASHAVAQAERAYALENSAPAWKGVTAAKEAKEKAATRLRVLETIAEETRVADEAKAEEARIAGLRVELEAAEQEERAPALPPHVRDLFVTSIAGLESAIASVDAQRMKRLGGNEEANRLRLALGLPTRSPDHLSRVDTAAILSGALADGVEAGSFVSTAAAKAALLVATRAADIHKSGIDSENARQNKHRQRLGQVKESRESHERLLARRVKERQAMEAAALKLEERNGRKGDCGAEAVDARRALAAHDEIGRRIAAEMKGEDEEIAEIEAEIASWGTK